MDKEKKLTKTEKKQKWMKLLIVFFAAMLILTVLSRVIDSVMLPKVDIGKKKEGKAGKLWSAITGRFRKNDNGRGEE